MGILSFLLDGKQSESRSLSDYAAAWFAGEDLGYGAAQSAAGVSVNTQSALGYSPFWRGVNLIAKDVGKLPLHMDKRDGKGWTHAVDHPGYNLLRHKPNEYMTAMVFRQTLQGQALTVGNGYAYINRNGAAEPVELILLDPNRVTPVRANGVLWYVYEFSTNEKRKLPYYDIIHIKGFSYDGLVGYNVVFKSKEMLGLAMARESYAANYFKNNARPSLVLTTPQTLKPETAKNIRDSWERIHSGIQNSHRTAVLEQGLEAKEISINARDSQLCEQEEFSFVHVANLLGIPPHKLGAKGYNAYASLEQQNQAYLDEGLDPWLITHEEEYRDKLLTEDEKRKDSHRVRFNRKELLRADLAARGAFYVQMMQWGVYSPDMVLDGEGENHQPGGIGDVFYRPLNMSIVKAEPEDDDGDEVPAITQQQAVKDGEELIDVPDIRQPTAWSCGAAAAMCVGKYFGVGPDSIEEWIQELGTDVEYSTKPRHISDYLARLGLAVTSAQNMTVNDLRNFWRKGMPVICPVQDYGSVREPGAKFLYGHYLTVIGAAMGYVFAQDSSEENVIEPGSDSVQAPGRIMIAEDEWMSIWHDKDFDGNEFICFGMAVAKELEVEPPPVPKATPTPSPVPPKALPAPKAPPARSEARCGGEGSGVPGPCSEGLADGVQAEKDQEQEEKWGDQADNFAAGVQSKIDSIIDRQESNASEIYFSLADDGRTFGYDAAHDGAEKIVQDWIKDRDDDARRESINSANEKLEKDGSPFRLREDDEKGLVIEETADAEKIYDAAAAKANEKLGDNAYKIIHEGGGEFSLLLDVDKVAEKAQPNVDKANERLVAKGNPYRIKLDKGEDSIEVIIDRETPAPSHVSPRLRAMPSRVRDTIRSLGFERSARRMLSDVIRRMTKRVALQGERAATDPKKFAAWLDTLDADNRATIRASAEPAEMALRALGQEVDVAAWLIERVHAEFLEMSGRCTAATLPSEAARLAAALVERLPKERCGGNGSGVPGPCPDSNKLIAGFKEKLQSIKDASGALAKAKACLSAMKSSESELRAGLRERYGVKGALAIIAAGQAIAWGGHAAAWSAGVPLYIPGSAILAMAPAAALAEGVRALSRRSDDAELSADQIKAEGQKVADAMWAAFRAWVKANNDDLVEAFKDLKDEA